jgi:hypothetical protein
VFEQVGFLADRVQQFPEQFGTRLLITAFVAQRTAGRDFLSSPSTKLRLRLGDFIPDESVNGDQLLDARVLALR